MWRTFPKFFRFGNSQTPWTRRKSLKITNVFFFFNFLHFTLLAFCFFFCFLFFLYSCTSFFLSINRTYFLGCRRMRIHFLGTTVFVLRVRYATLNLSSIEFLPYSIIFPIFTFRKIDRNTGFLFFEIS